MGYALVRLPFHKPTSASDGASSDGTYNDGTAAASSQAADPTGEVAAFLAHGGASDSSATAGN